MAEMVKTESDQCWALAGKVIEGLEFLGGEKLRAQKGLNVDRVAKAQRNAERFNEAVRLRDLCVLECKDYPKMLFIVEEGLQVWAAQGEGREARDDSEIRGFQQDLF